jgi:hypothetical protein
MIEDELNKCNNENQRCNPSVKSINENQRWNPSVQPLMILSEGSTLTWS